MSELVSKYVPRDMFLPFHNRTQKKAAMVTHRRAGKTVACVNELITRAMYSRRPMSRYGYVAPFRQQAKNVAWEYLKYYTEGMTSKISESELYVELAHNKARIGVFGADNMDAFLGMYFDGLVLDEYGKMDPTVYKRVLAPTLADRDGWIVFIGTPNGKNHFYQQFTKYQLDSSAFHMLARVTDTGIFSSEKIAEFQIESGDEDFQQEYMCDFSASLVRGAYYAKMIDWLEARGHMDAAIAYDPQFPVSVSADLGYTDSSALWFWQNRPDGFAMIDYYESHGAPLPHYFKFLSDKPYTYEKIWLPHDAKAKTLQTGRSTLEQFMSAEFPVDIVPRLSVHDGINAARKVLPQCWFAPACHEGLEMLRAYRRKYDEAKRVYMDDPLHDFASHGSDSFRYFALVAQTTQVAEEKANHGMILPEPWRLQELFEERESRMRKQRSWH